MIKYPQSVLNLIESFSLLPGIGRKSAERLAFYVLDNMKIEDVEEFTHNLEEVKKNVRHCNICGNISETDTCSICSDEQRDKKVILVVESVRDVLSIEKLNEYQGLYHVLGGSISFSRGISAKDLNIDNLLKRIEQEDISEVILATNATLEGETTAKYLRELINSIKDIKISRIAYGLPVGSDLLYADQMTLSRALEGRREYK